MAYRISSGDGECWPDLDRPEVWWFPDWCLERTDLLPSALGLATSAIEDVALVNWWSDSPLSNPAMRAERLSDAWLRLFRAVVCREVNLVWEVDGGFDVSLLEDAPRLGFWSLPLPRRGPLRIWWRLNLFFLVEFHGMTWVRQIATQLLGCWGSTCAVDVEEDGETREASKVWMNGGQERQKKDSDVRRSLGAGLCDVG
jgi:hypothetical protein